MWMGGVSALRIHYLNHRNAVYKYSIHICMTCCTKPIRELYKTGKTGIVIGNNVKSYATVLRPTFNLHTDTNPIPGPTDTVGCKE